jgi:serine/threonine protein kinase
MSLAGELAGLPPEERDNRLGELHDDPALRQRVVTLLNELNDADCTRDATDAAAAAGADASPPVERIGPYRLVRRIGAGGMGEVYEAEQDRPRRLVALKLIHRLRMTGDLLRRFEFEVEVLGRLEHPGIARVYEAGTAQTPFGPQPYFAMELVRGLRLDHWARLRRPDLQQRLQMLIKICEAMQHAHQHGVIHRDLKPSNILVSESDEPKVLDFGVATAVRGSGNAGPDQTLHTATGQLVGTLQYMSPEQAAGDTRGLDTRCDVYALGVIAYQLLSDRLPYDVSSKTIPEAMRVIQDEQPSRLGTINRNLRGDLETIVFKALAKEKQQRYASCAELGADVKRYLSYEPIAARPPSLRYQLGKFARKHKMLVGAGVAILLALLGGITVSTIALIDARRARHIAVLRQTDAEQSRQVAEQISSFLMNLLTSIDPAEARGNQVTVREVLDRADGYIAAHFADQPFIEAELRRRIGRTYRSLGQYEPARMHLDRAVEVLRAQAGHDDPRTLAAENDLAWVLDAHGQYALAEWFYRDIIARGVKALGEDDRQRLSWMNNLAANLDDQGRWPEAQALHKDTLERRQRAFGDDDVDTLQSMHNLGWSLSRTGEVETALMLLRLAVEKRTRILGPDDPGTLASASAYGSALCETDRAAEAEPVLRDTLSRCRRVLGDHHPGTLAAASQLAMALLRLGHPDEAERVCAESLQRARPGAGDDAIGVLQLTNLRARMLMQLGRGAEAAPVLNELLGRMRRIFGPQHHDTLIVQGTLGGALTQARQIDRAEPLLREVVSSSNASNIPPAQFCTILVDHAACLCQLGRFDQAREALLRAKKTLEDSKAPSIEQMRQVITALADTCESARLTAEAAQWRAELVRIRPGSAPATQAGP